MISQTTNFKTYILQTYMSHRPGSICMHFSFQIFSTIWGECSMSCEWAFSVLYTCLPLEKCLSDCCFSCTQPANLFNCFQNFVMFLFISLHGNNISCFDTNLDWLINSQRFHQGFSPYENIAWTYSKWLFRSSLPPKIKWIICINLRNSLGEIVKFSPCGFGKHADEG